MRLAQRMAAIQPSETLAITAKAKALRAQGIAVVNFAAGEPDFDTPAHIKAAAEQAIRDGKTKYTPSSGLPELRQAISRRLASDRGLTYAPEQIIVSCGAKHAIANALQVLCEAGDEVLIPSPYWVSYPPLVQLTGATPRIIETTEATGFKLIPDQLRAHLTPRARVLILNSPSNPTGAVYSAAELRALGEAVLSHDLLVLSDEIYEHLVFPPHRHSSMASLSRALAERTLFVSGVSKTYAMTGWRIGYLAAPPAIAEAVDRLQSHSTSNPASISQYAALAALEGSIDGIRPMVEAFHRRRDLMVSRLQHMVGISCVEPGGAFYVFGNISQLRQDSVQLADQWLAEAHVATVPGKPFGSDQHVRFSFATDEASIEEGMRRLEQWVTAHARG